MTPLSFVTALFLAGHASHILIIVLSARYQTDVGDCIPKAEALN